MEYKSEKEFLKKYNVKEYDQLSMTTDILIISVSSEKATNYKKNDKKMMSILLVKREDYPYKYKWCLPGGFLNPKTETLEECAKRILKRETNIDDIYLEQLYTFDKIDRDPRCRVVSTSYVALIDKNRLNNIINKNASWFDITLIQEKNNNVYITLDNGNETLHLNIKKVCENYKKSIKLSSEEISNYTDEEMEISCEQMPSCDEGSINNTQPIDYDNTQLVDCDNFQDPSETEIPS